MSYPAEYPQLETVGEMMAALLNDGKGDDPVYARSALTDQHFIVRAVERVGVAGEQRTVIVVREVDWDDDGNATLDLLLGVLGALSFMALTALFLYSSYRHYSIPLHHGRGSDVWGTMAFISFWGAVITGVFTLFMADE